MAKPKIRFKGYTDDWEQRKLGEVLDDMYNGQTPSRKRDEYWNGNIRWLSSGELNRGIVYSSIETITEEGKKSANLRVVPKGTFVMAITGLEASGTRGNCALLGFDTTLNQSCMALFPKQDILISQFLFQWYRMVGEEYGINYTQGTKQQSYNAELIKILPILLPSIDEQKKIASYLNSIDHLITLHQRKNIYFYEKVTLVWEQRKFSEFVKNVAVRNKAGVELECYAVTNDRGFISQKEAHDAFGYMADADTTAYNIVPPSSFAYNPARINVGSIGYYTGTENVIVSSLYEVFQTADYVDDRFMWHWFKSDHFSKWIERLQEGSVRLYFYYDKLIQCEMKMPSLEEQKKMGAFFDQLDHLITLHQCKCHLLHKLLHNDWEQRKLGEIAFSFEYGLNAAAKEYDGENKYIRITDIDNNTHEFLTYNLTSPDIDLTDAENYKLAEGDILLARTGASVGKSYIYRDSDGLVYYAGFLIRARIREEYDAEFVFQSTLTDKYNKYIAVTSQRSGQPGMNAQEYSEFEILVPEKEEQTKIGTYFRILDHLITLHHRKYIYILKSP